MRRPPRRGRPDPVGRAAGATRVDARLVKQLVEAVNAAATAGPLETAETIGGILLEGFYGGDLEVYAAIGDAHVSMQALARDAGLGRPGLVAWNALRFVEQRASLPARVLPGLTYAHHRALFRVREPRMKARLALETQRQGWSAGELTERVAEAIGEDGSGRGRPPAHPTLAAVKAVGKAMRELDADALAARELRDLSPLRRQRAAEACETYAERLLDAAKRLRSVR